MVTGHWRNERIQIRRSKTPAGWRDPSLDDACVRALRELWSRTAKLGFNEPDHYVFPWHGRDKKIDPTRPPGEPRGGRSGKPRALNTFAFTMAGTRR